MQSIQSYRAESNMEAHLKNAYRECWQRLLHAIPSLTEDELLSLSNPFLVKPLPCYRKAKKKVLFVGQETNGWDSFEQTLVTFNRESEENNREGIIEYLQWMYEDLRYHRKWDHTPFWKGVRRLFQAISPGEGDDGFLHTQLVRFDVGNKRPPHHIENLLQREYNILPMEIAALSPDVIVFLTGPYYDDRLRETFRNVGRLGDNLVFEPISGFRENELIRIAHPVLPFHTYRTYHPGYSLQRHEQTVFEPIEDALQSLVKKSVP
ncbi:hypothetical protein ACTID9_11465 [Brevibacillus fluminis]|uniref:hypothetical protein n=1 Tax=Brevibacillus fluminis TaxID=511487 RepID=UPI003F89AC6A